MAEEIQAGSMKVEVCNGSRAGTAILPIARVLGATERAATLLNSILLGPDISNMQLRARKGKWKKVSGRHKSGFC